MNMPRLWQLCCLLTVAILLSACETINYYSQAAAGQWQLWRQRQPIEQLLADETTDPQLRRRLIQVQAILQFATEQLLLPDNNSYRFYTDLERPYVVWNVFAAPVVSVNPKQWCFPVAGCVSYRGYFSERAAMAYADKLAADGYDTYVGGVAAYSTLGWFDDPVLNTFIHRDEVHLAALIFHELAHQQLYVPGDTNFNESFARAVEIAGVSRWLQSLQRIKSLQRTNGPQQVKGARQDELDHANATANDSAKNSQRPLSDYLRQQQINDDFVAMILATRERLSNMYQQNLTTEQKLAAKQLIFDDLKGQHYSDFKRRWNGVSGYDSWMSDSLNHRSLNNAKLATVANYHQWLPAFQHLLIDENNDLFRFYQRANALAELDSEHRLLALEGLNSVR